MQRTVEQRHTPRRRTSARRLVPRREFAFARRGIRIRHRVSQPGVEIRDSPSRHFDAGNERLRGRETTARHVPRRGENRRHANNGKPMSAHAHNSH